MARDGAARRRFARAKRETKKASGRQKCRLVGGAGWSSPVARQAHNLKVVGSNPTPATNKTGPSRGLFCLFWRGLDWKIVQPEQWQRHCGDQLAQPVNPTPATNAKASRQSRLALRCPGLDPGPTQPKHKAIIQAPSRGLFFGFVGNNWMGSRQADALCFPACSGPGAHHLL